jgi:hypothetical protein
VICDVAIARMESGVDRIDLLHEFGPRHREPGEAHLGRLITAWRNEQVDFAHPTPSGISSIIVPGPSVPAVLNVEDLSREVYLLKSDVSSDSVERFNAQLAASGKPPVKIRPAAEVLADEDLLEIVMRVWRPGIPGVGGSTRTRRARSAPLV